MSLWAKEKIASRDFLCGFGAAVTETVITQPITKLVFRQKLHNIYVHDAAKQLYSEGFQHLFRGILSRMLQKAPSRAIMFGSYDFFRLMVVECDPVKTLSICHGCAAFLAGAAESVLVPLERIETLMQTKEYNNKFRNTVDAFLLIRSHGIREYYRGSGITIMRNGVSNVIFFGFREPLHNFVTNLERYKDSKPWTVQVIGRFFSGAVLGTFSAFLTYPLNVVRVRYQSQLGGKFDTSLNVFREVMKERNYKINELYRGVHLTCVKSFMAWGVMNATYELLKLLLV